MFAENVIARGVKPPKIAMPDAFTSKAPLQRFSCEKDLIT